MPPSEDSLAVELGFTSADEMHNVPRSPRTVIDFARIPAEARAIRSDASAAIANARRRGLSLDQAAFEAGVPIEALTWWFPEAVLAQRSGELHAAPADGATRLRPIAVEGEVTFVAMRGSDAADRVARLFAVQWDFVTNRASAEDVRALPDVTIAGRRLERDPRVLAELARAGDFDLDDIYRELVG